jgi:hypothetical protein
MDDVNIYLDEVVLDGSSPLSPENLHVALSPMVPAVTEKSLAHIADAVADHLSSRFGTQ